MNQPFIARVYEGYWRPAFVTVATRRVPNRGAEFEQACRYLCGGDKALQDDAPVVDLSCGPGLFARHLIESENFRHVYALDLSEPMVKQCVKLGEHLGSELCVIRGDVHELPFQDGQVAAVHAGAAFHMWPQPSKAVHEIFRILRPGGVFVASTFVHKEGRRLSKAAATVFERSTNTTIFDPSKLRDMLSEAGFVGFEETRRGIFSLFRVSRPL
jgi:SAM-dependent methyltransferase